MPRPFRFQPPSPPPETVARPRLLEQLAERWNRRVTTLVAGPGFGKTALLSTAMLEPRPAGSADIWLSCEPADEDADHLRSGLAHALGRPDDSPLIDLLDAVWARAPHDVCLVFDDVHEIPPESSGAELLSQLTTELARNAHLVFASREPIPVPLARLAASGEVTRLGEKDLLFEPSELASLATTSDLAPEVLESTGGWPALAALTVNVGSDLVIDYLWEEVLTRVGDERSVLLAQFAAVGGGDDEIASELAGHAITLDDVVDGVPLVERTTDGWAALHPLWGPALRALLDPMRASNARRRAAGVHRRHRRFDTAVDLLVEAEAWDDILTVIRESEQLARTAWVDGWEPDSPASFGRWFRLLPIAMRDEPEAFLAAGLEAAALEPSLAPAMFDAAAAGFRAQGALDDEMTALSHGGLVRWWADDFEGMAELYGRVLELAGEGFERAQAIAAFGLAGLAHLGGDSATVLSTLDGMEHRVDRGWVNTVYWLQSVAHRRDGDLVRASERLDRAEAAIRTPDPQLDIARQRVLWLEGSVEPVTARLTEHFADYLVSGHKFLAREAALEVAAKLAMIGDLDKARVTLAEAPHLAGSANVLVRVLEAIAWSAIDVGDDDEEAAAARLTSEAIDGDAAIGQPASWYWRDRAAIALVHVLVPDTRPAWDAQPLAACHRVGVTLAVALEAARAGDLDPVRSMTWPDAGVVRVHLPLRWVAELAAAGTAAGNPPPDDLLAAIGELAAPVMADLAASKRPGAITDGVNRLAGRLAVAPAYHLDIAMIGPLEVRRDGELVTHPALRRRRVRELLCYLVVHRHVRREVIEDQFWSDSTDPAHNLRVTLNYLQQILQPDRDRGAPPFFVESNGSLLTLRVTDHLHIDAWDLETHLDAAAEAERSQDIEAAIEHYRVALPLWRGEPFADVPYEDWAEPARARLRSRYASAATRVGELWMTAGDVDLAQDAAERAVTADSIAEPAYRLLARVHRERNDRPRALAALRSCAAALADLGVEPDASTKALLVDIERAGS